MRRKIAALFGVELLNLAVDFLPSRADTRLDFTTLLWSEQGWLRESTSLPSAGTNERRGKLQWWKLGIHYRRAVRGGLPLADASFAPQAFAAATISAVVALFLRESTISFATS